MPSDLSYLYPLYPILGGIACLLCFIPILWHWKAGNVAVTALGLWILGLNFMFWIGTIAWHDTILNPYPVWGDIVNYFMVMWPTATASTTLCIQFRLWQVARARSVFITKKEKRRRRYSTWALCLGLPILVIPIHYIVQGHRYNVFEDLGPVIETYDVTLAFPLFFIIDPAICVIEGVFAILTIRILLTHRKEMNTALSTGSSNVNKNHFVRLLCLSAIAVLVHLPLSLWVLICNATEYSPEPWISWDDTHSNYGRIAYYTRFAMQQSQDSLIGVSVMLFATTLCAFNYFFLFGFGEEATKHYKSFIGAIVRPFGIKYPREEQRTVIKRTWRGAMFGKLGKAVNPPIPTPSTRHLDPNSSKFYRLGKSDSFFSQTTAATMTGDNDIIDMTNLDFHKGNTKRPSFASTMGESNHECDRWSKSVTERQSCDITDRRESDKSKATSEPTLSDRGRDNDLEAQEPSRSEDQHARRKEILEKDPELTEEVTF